MPPKKGISTPNKPPENPTWTLDEGEEMRRDINDLQKKIVLTGETVLPSTGRVEPVRGCLITQAVWNGPP